MIFVKINIKADFTGNITLDAGYQKDPLSFPHVCVKRDLRRYGPSSAKSFKT